MDIVTDDGEIVDGLTSLTTVDAAVLSEMTRVEIDQQIATARRYPRILSQVMSAILQLVTQDEQSAAECMYALPRGGKPIVGPSVRFAEAVVSQWGNCRVAARVIDTNHKGKYIEAEGLFHDLQTNMARRATVRRRITDKRGNLYNDDMITMTGNAACSIALRNAILAGVPRAIWRKAYEAAEAAIRGDIKTLAERRDQMFKTFAAYGVKPDQIFALLEIKGQDDLTLDHLPVLVGIYQAIKSGEETVERIFDPRRVGPTHAVVANPLSDKAPSQEAKPKEAAAPKKAAQKEPATEARTVAEDARGEPEATDAPANTETPASDAENATASDPGEEGDDPDAPAAEMTAAYKAGKEARRRQMGPKAVPTEYREAGREADAADWKLGWQDQDAAMKAGA